MTATTVHVTLAVTDASAHRNITVSRPSRMRSETLKARVNARQTTIAPQAVLYTPALAHADAEIRLAVADQKITTAMHVLKTLTVIPMVYANATKDGADVTVTSTVDTAVNAATLVPALLTPIVLYAQARQLLDQMVVKLHLVYSTVESTVMSIMDLATATAATTAVTAQDHPTATSADLTPATSTEYAYVLKDTAEPAVKHTPEHATVVAPLVLAQMPATAMSASLTPPAIT